MEMKPSAEESRVVGAVTRSESEHSRCTLRTPRTPHTPLSADSMPTIYRSPDEISKQVGSYEGVSGSSSAVYELSHTHRIQQNAASHQQHASACRAPIASLDCMDGFSANSQPMLVDPGDFPVVRRLSSVFGGSNDDMPQVPTPGLRYKNLGKSGVKVSNVGLGLWSTLGESAEDVIMTALESGINLFDLSDAHNIDGEVELGSVMKKKNVKRTSVIVCTKIYWSTRSDERGLSRKHIIESVKASLERLQMDYIDVVLVHKTDLLCPMEEVVRAMNFLVNKGMIQYWGTARWTPSEIMEAYNNCRQFNCVAPVIEQTEYHMFCREKAELFMPELYHKIGVGTITWSAMTAGRGMTPEDIGALFARSRFNRKYSTFSWCEDDMKSSTKKEPGEIPRTYGEKLRDLANLAGFFNCSLSQLAIAWTLKNENVNCLLLGATNVDTLKDNLNALQVVPQLTDSVMAEIDRILGNKPQRPPMVSTLAMRNLQNLNIAAAARADMAAAGSAAVTPKAAEEGGYHGEIALPGKDVGQSFCEIQ